MDRIRTLMTLALTLPLIGAIAMGCNSGTQEPDAPAAEKAEPSSEAAGETPTENATAPVASENIDPSRFPELPAGVQAAVPDNYPTDLPVYPGAVPAQGRGSVGDDGEVAALQLLTNDTVDRTFDYYKNDLESNGWEVGKADNSTAGGAISVTKGDCKATFMFVPSDTGTGTDIFTISACADES